MRDLCGGEGLADAVRCSAAGNVVAVERGAKRDEVEEVFAELGREHAEFFERNCIELKILVEAEADGVANDLVGLAEGHALVGEVSGRGHRVKVAGFRGALHNTEAELERTGEVGQDAEQAERCVDGVEDLLLTLLEIFVVSEREAFHKRHKGDGCADETGGFAAGEFREVGVLLLRHRGGSGGEGLGEFDEVELGGGVEGDLFSEARDVQAERGGGLGEVEHEVAVGGRVDGVGRGRGEVERVGRDVAIEGERGSGDGSAA